jgi:hypothetical protein
LDAFLTSPHAIFIPLHLVNRKHYEAPNNFI